MDVIGGAGISKQSWVVLVGKAELASLAAKAVGNDMNKEYILYCDTGKTATSWAFVMTEMLGYKDVNVYDGSSMEWLKDPNAPTEP